MLPHFALELEQQAGCLEFSVAVLVGQAVQAVSLGTVSGHVHVTVERQDALDVLDQVQ